MRFVSRTVDPRYLAVFRIAYSMVGLALVGQMVRQADFLWLRSDPHHRVGTTILAVLLALLVAMLAGAGGRIVRVAHFAGVAFLVRILPISCIDYSLYMIAALWSCFLDLNVIWSLDLRWTQRFSWYPRVFRPPLRARAWPILLLGCNLGLLIFSAGILKHYDPQWLRGEGLYFTFLLPWIKPPWLAPLLQFHWAFRLVNYAVIVLEYSVFPLFLWHRTRSISVVMTTAFFAGLIFPFRIDPIGYIGVTACICLAAFARMPRESSIDARADDRSMSSRLASAGFIVFVLGFLTFVFAVLHLHEFTGRLASAGGERVYVRWPLAVCPPTAETKVSKALAPAIEPAAPIVEVGGTTAPASVSGLHRFFRAFEDAAISVNWYSTRLQVNHVFSIADSRGNYLYRVVLTLTDGSTREPFKVFEENMRPGPFSSGILVPRFMQGSMYDLTFAIDQIAFNHTDPGERAWSLMERMIQFSRSRLTSAEQEKVVASRILVRPILMPLVFEGNVEPWNASSWTEFYSKKGDGRGTFRMDMAPYPMSYPLNAGWCVKISP